MLRQEGLCPAYARRSLTPFVIYRLLLAAAIVLALA
jgi:hypothetical protein